MMPQPSEALKRLTKNFEGLRLKPYSDGGGLLTVGYGHRTNSHEPITQEDADRFFENDMAHAANTVNKYINVTLTQNQYDALCDFAFNIGDAAFHASTLARLLNKRLYTAVPDQLRRWVHDARGKVEGGLVKRRNAEIALWEAKA